MASFGVSPPFHAGKAYQMQINNFVYVMHPENGGVCLPPGEVPEWAESLITNPAVIIQSAVPVPPKIEPEPEKKGDEGSGDNGDDAAIKAADAEGLPPAGSGDDAGDGSKPEEVPVPPKGGRGGSAEAWAKYAASKGFEVDGTAKASEIREALEAEGIPTE